MGTKFRVSPKIDAQLSQCTEGRTRDKNQIKSKQNEKKEKTTDSQQGSDKGPKTKGLEPEKRDGEPAPKQVPYVDLPPKRMTRVTEPVSQRQPKEEPTYKNRAPVEMGLDIEKLVDSVMEMEVTVPLKSLAGVSGAIQKEIRKQVTKARILVEERQTTKPKAIEGVHKVYLHDLKCDSIVIQEDVSEDIQAGFIMGGDPVLQYISQNADTDTVVTRLIVGKMTEPLRAIYPKINGIGQEESLLDAGSMIVSMNKQVVIQLGLIWDPLIRIDMESASNHVERTLGVARNVPFDIGPVKLFLQVHILENPPYRVLLGKPFETLAATVIQTYEDGSSEIVVKDPNTKRIAVVPTYKRGEPPEELQKNKQLDF